MNQCTYYNLEEMRNVDIRYIDLETIPDSRNIEINTNEPILERVLDYIRKVGNPYLIRCGNILVKIEYANTETTINDCIEGYFRSLT